MKRLVRGIAWRGLKRLDLLVERIADLLGNFVVEPETGDDRQFRSQLAVSPDAGARTGQAYHMLAAPEAARSNAVDDSFPTFRQVNEDRFVIAAQSQFYLPVPCGSDGNHPDLSKMNAAGSGVERSVNCGAAG